MIANIGAVEIVLMLVVLAALLAGFVRPVALATRLGTRRSPQRD